MKYNIKSYGKTRTIYQKFLHGLCKHHFFYISSPIRVLPDFFVIGVVRSGTTSLYHYLGQHPSIKRASYDELGYFDDNYHLGQNWYKSLFPTKYTKQKIQKKFGKFLTYDVTPFYIYNPLVVQRIFKNFPDGYFEIIQLNNDFGPAVLEKEVQALIVSDETSDQGNVLNKLRSERNLSPVEIITVPMFLAKDGVRISTTRIKNSEIDVDGNLLPID